MLNTSVVRAIGLSFALASLEFSVLLEAVEAQTSLRLVAVALALAAGGGLVVRPSRPRVASLMTVSVVVVFANGVGTNHAYLMAIVATVLGVFDASWHAPMLRIQTSIVYGFATIAKLNGSYLSGARLEEELSASPLWSATGLPLSLSGPLAYASLLIEAFLAVGFWSPRLRATAIIGGIALHGGIILFAATDLLTLVQLAAFGVLLVAMWGSFAGYVPSGGGGLLEPDPAPRDSTTA